MREYDEKEIRYSISRKALEDYWKRKVSDAEWEEYCIQALDRLDFSMDDLADND
jgi:hypothetical protein